MRLALSVGFLSLYPFVGFVVSFPGFSFCFAVRFVFRGGFLGGGFRTGFSFLFFLGGVFFHQPKNMPAGLGVGLFFCGEHMDALAGINSK